MLKLVKRYEQNKCIYLITSGAEKYLNEINRDTDIYENSSSTEKVKEIKGQAIN